MKWITTDYKGDKQIWYSEDVIEKIKYIVKHSLCKYTPDVQYTLDEILKIIEMGSQNDRM